LVAANVPVSATEQLAAAYVPVIVVPLIVPDTLIVQLVESLGVKVSETPAPLVVPAIEQQLSLAVLGNVVAHVPDTVLEDWVKLSVMVT
jgi:hypothetical protein